MRGGERRLDTRRAGSYRGRMADPPTAPSRLQVAGSRTLAQWMARENTALAFTSHRRGALFFLGLAPDGTFYCHPQPYRRATGLHLTPEGSLFVGGMRRVWRLENVLAQGARAGAHDRLYQPRQAWTVGEVDLHELALDRAGRLVFANTQYSCLATSHWIHAFQPIWKPPFITALEPQDRCHLNGLALEDGAPRYVTMLGAADAPEGWRAAPTEGLLIDVRAERAVASGLAMPHSPRLHDGRLYALESGRGMLVEVDRATGETRDIAFAPGFLRGLSFHGGAAAVTLSLPRGDQAFAALPIHAELQHRLLTPSCGVHLIALQTGELLGRLELTGVDELFDVAFLPGCTAPAGLPLEPADNQVSVSFDPAFAPLDPPAT
ncbi:MAG TPA: TIGR03032 family protein [Caulobacteraceae bacterium]